MPYIFAGVTTSTKKSGRGWLKRLYWRLAQRVVGKGLFIHCYLAFSDHGRELVYHSTAMGAHVTSQKTFLLNRTRVYEWRFPASDEKHEEFVASCFDDSGLVPYGHLQNLTLGIIKWINELLPERWQITKNPFGQGNKKQNCSERAGTKLAELTGRFISKDPDLYGPDDFYEDCLSAERTGRAEATIRPVLTESLLR